MERKHIQVENSLLMQEITRMFSEKGKESVTIMVKGYSMRPFLENGRDKAVLIPPRTPDIGDVVLARTGNGRFALHRVIRIDGKRYTMQGDGNPTCMTEEFTEADIIGIARGFVRKGRYIATDSRKWRAYSAVWRLLKPIRRILLAVYRRTVK